MTLGGWITMIVSVGFVTGLLAWCIGRVLSPPRPVEDERRATDVETSEDHGEQ